MINLKNALRNEAYKRVKEYKEYINSENNDIFKRDSPRNSKRFDKLTKEQKIEYLIDKRKKEIEKQLNKDLSKIDIIKESNNEIESITVQVEWTPSRMWGSNPKATVSVYLNGAYNSYRSGSIGGCGYDKESTAISEALNQIPELLKLLYLIKDSNIDKSNNDLFGYGMSCGILPEFSGGCGVSCYSKNFKTLNMKFEGIAFGKSFNVYKISKIC